MIVTAFAAVPLGVAAGVYLENIRRKELAYESDRDQHCEPRRRPLDHLRWMALGLLVYKFRLGQSVLTGGLTLAFLILPIVIVATREALRTIPQGIRESAYALGSTKWQVVRHHLLPYSVGGTMTGIIIALSRAIGETGAAHHDRSVDIHRVPAAATNSNAAAIYFF